MAALSILRAGPAEAEIIKTATRNCDRGEICFYWWPKLPAVAGWHTDQAANVGYGGNGMNSLVPDGSTFARADVIMYAAAVYKPRYEAGNPQSKSLSALIEDDEATVARAHQGTSIAEVESLTTADGQSLRSFTFFRPDEGTWERVSYGEEDDFYLLFAISAHSEAGYRKALPVYEDVVGRYRK